MKYSDDYGAKFVIWARESKVYPMPKMVGLPRFGAKKFSSYEQMNAWKKEMLDQIAANGGVRWKS